MIDWSYDALSEPERIVFRRLSVFVGGWELAQAEQSLILAPDNESLDILSLQNQLVAKSLISIHSNVDGHSRYYFLETLREYAKEKLLESGEMTAMRLRHANILAQQVGISARIIDGPDQKKRLDHIQNNHGNFEAALEWSFSEGNSVTGCSLVCGLTCFWAMRTRFSRQAARWTQLARQSLSDQTPLSIQAGVWVAATMFSSTDESLVEDSQRAVHLFQQAGDDEGLALAMFRLAQALFWSNRKAEGRRMLEEGVTLARNIGESGEWLLRLNFYCLGSFAENDGELDQAEYYYQEALRQYQAASDLSGTAETLHLLSNLAIERLQFDVALSLAEQALLASQDLEDIRLEIWIHLTVAEVLRLAGKCDKSEVIVLDAIKMSSRYGNEYQLACATLLRPRQRYHKIASTTHTL